MTGCRCLLCLMERNLMNQFAGCEGHDAYQKFAASLPALSSFPTAADLICFLHSEQNIGNGRPTKNGILAELLVHTTSNGRASTSQELLLWTFVPMLHRISRQVLTRFPVLPSDDIAQHVVTALLESFGSREFVGCESHLAFGLARHLRRDAFGWAERETRTPSLGSVGVDSLASVSDGDGPQPIERAALLRHFLERCRRIGVLTEEDLTLLVQFKLDEVSAARISNATRQRMKRLLAKLRRAANHTRRAKLDARQLRLFD